MMTEVWTVLLAVTLSSLQYRAYDRIPKNPELSRFYSEDTSERVARQMVRIHFGTELMPGDDWILIDCPFSHGIRSIGAREPIVLESGTTRLHVLYRLSEIPQDHPSMALQKGQVRSYVAFLEGESFPDSLTLHLQSGKEERIVIWRGARAPDSTTQGESK